MNKLDEILTVLEQLRNWSHISDIVVPVVIIIALIVTYYWQRHQINSLKDYIDLWRPAELRNDLVAYTEIKDEIHQASIDQYRLELSKKEDNLDAAMDIIEQLQKKNDILMLRAFLDEKPSDEELTPISAKSLSRNKDEDHVIWTIKFKNGIEKRFKFPVRKDVST